MAARWVLIRGLARSNGHWADFPDLLRKINPDLKIDLLEIPGNGSRHTENTPTSAEEIINDFRSQLHLHHTGQLLRLVGISLGGMLALKWAEMYPDEIEDVTLINSSLGKLSSPFQRLLPHNYSLIGKTLLCRNPELRERYILLMTLNNNRVIEKHLSNFKEISLRFPLRIKNVARQLLLANKILINTSIKVPVTVIASEGDKLVHPNCSRRIAQEFDGQLILHPTAGHDLPLEEPEWLAKILLDRDTN